MFENRHVNQWNIVEDHKVDSHSYSLTAFQQGCQKHTLGQKKMQLGELDRRIPVEE